MTNTWTPNEKQTAFLEVLKSAEKPLTLAEVSERANIKFATGTINTLVAKGLVSNDTEREIVCECCGHKKKVKEYKIA